MNNSLNDKARQHFERCLETEGPILVAEQYLVAKVGLNRGSFFKDMTDFWSAFTETATREHSLREPNTEELRKAEEILERIEKCSLGNGSEGLQYARENLHGEFSRIAYNLIQAR